MAATRMLVDCPHCRAHVGTVEAIPEQKACPDCDDPIVHVAYSIECPSCGGWCVSQRWLHSHRPSAWFGLAEARPD